MKLPRALGGSKCSAISLAQPWSLAMRWFWIDRFTEFQSGQYATAVKNVSMAEDHLHDHFPAAPIMPNSLIIEGIAQTGGLLVAEHGKFQERVVLAKISKARFHFQAVPGDTLVYRTVIEDIPKDGAIVSGTAHVGERLQAELVLNFWHIGEDVAGKSLFEPVAFLTLLKMLRIFEVGRAADGSPLEMPDHLARLEHELKQRDLVN
jgi:3-hydroxyacyl-[acyl-carrier-protein] dehydratase